MRSNQVNDDNEMNETTVRTERESKTEKRENDGDWDSNELYRKSKSMNDSNHSMFALPFRRPSLCRFPLIPLPFAFLFGGHKPLAHPVPMQRILPSRIP